MIILLVSIILLFISRKYFSIHKILINRVIIGLSIWLVLGSILRHFLSDGPTRQYTDIEMAQTWIKDNPEISRGAKTKILDDGSVRIILKKRKYLHLKDGVLTNGK
jgi:uncharacterized membrane protein